MHVLLNHSYAPLNKCSGSWMSPRLVFIVNTPALNLMQYHCAHTPWFNINLCITWLQLCLQAPRQQLCLAGYIESWSLPVIFKQHKPLRIYFNMAQTHRRAEAMSHIDKIQYPDGLFWNSIAHQGGWHYKQQSAHSKVQKMTECNDKTHMWDLLRAAWHVLKPRRIFSHPCNTARGHYTVGIMSSINRIHWNVLKSKIAMSISKDTFSYWIFIT